METGKTTGNGNSQEQATAMGAVTKKIQHIGKITLDLTYDSVQDPYDQDPVAEELLQIARGQDPAEYSRIIEEQPGWEKLYHLSPLRENIVEWLPMDKTMKVLEVGAGCGAVTGILSRKAGQADCLELSKKRSLINAYRHRDCGNITLHVGHFQDIEPSLPQDYDYICLIGAFAYAPSYCPDGNPYVHFLDKLRAHLKEDGRIVIAMENKLGLKYWAGCKEDHLGTWFAGIEDYPQGGGVRTFTRHGLEKIFQSCGIEEYAFYYPYPDYTFMTTLYSDAYLPKPGELSNNLRNFDQDRMVLFDEKKAFDNILREGLFPLYANSYLAVIGQKPDIHYVKYSNDRQTAFRIRTQIQPAGPAGATGQDRTVPGCQAPRREAPPQPLSLAVRKYPLCQEAHAHIRSIETACQKLQARYQGGALQVNRCKLVEEAPGQQPYVELEYVKGVTLAELLDERLERRDMEGFLALFRHYLSLLDYHSETPVADYDPIFSNILVSPQNAAKPFDPLQGSTWTLIDYEWTLEKQVDTRELAFRAIYCYLLEDRKRNVLDPDLLLQELGITEEMAEEYRSREMAFQRSVTGQHCAMSELQSQIGHKCYRPLDFLENIHLEDSLGNIQVYEDRGQGFQEETSYFPDETVMADEQGLHVTLTLDAGLQKLRIDPAHAGCLVRIRQLEWNGSPLPWTGTDSVMTSNGTRLADTGSFVFSTQDPNLVISLEGQPSLETNTLKLCLERSYLGPKMALEVEKMALASQDCAGTGNTADDIGCEENGKEEVPPMGNPVKKKIQEILVQRRHKLYEKQIAKQALPYDMWIEELLGEEAAEIARWEANAGKPGAPGKSRLSVGVLSWEDFCRYVLQGTGSAGENLPNIWIVTPQPSCLVPDAALEVERYFLEHPSCEIAYGDEDGYFKPDWSPDLLQSFFYFGNVFALRRSLAEKLMAEHWKEVMTTPKAQAGTSPEGPDALLLKKQLYEIVLCCIDEAGEAGHLDRILFRPQDAFPAATDWGMEPEYVELKKRHLYTDAEIPARKEAQELVSVIIPSKDHPDILSTCIRSLVGKTSYQNLEILVVDNGSREKNRQKILELQQQMQRKGMLSFHYIYQPMTFNFSAMCNLGAREASGKYLLFLNDDIEIVCPDWLSQMVARGAKDYVGAVGAKLLYPDSDMIQHAGVTNIHLGPAHKLQFSSDRETYYHGINRCAVNVSAVTGACLLVRKAVFEEIGGFEERLQVAFNDVEFCFHLLRAGYKNVCCNQTYLYHHESLSRGTDDGEEKVARLHRELDFLRKSYPEMWNRDPYYSRRLVTDVLDRGFYPACRFEESRMSKKAVPVPIKGQLHPVWHNETLFMGLEFAGDEAAWRTGIPGGGDYYIQGWSYALHVDNSRYQKSLLLKRVQKDREEAVPGLWKIPFEECYRPDFQEGMTHIDHPALSGVSVWIARNALPAGEYLIGFFWEDTCSRQKLYGFSAEKIRIV